MKKQDVHLTNYKIKSSKLPQLFLSQHFCPAIREASRKQSVNKGEVDPPSEALGTALWTAFPNGRPPAHITSTSLHDTTTSPFLTQPPTYFTRRAANVDHGYPRAPHSRVPFAHINSHLPPTQPGKEVSGSLRSRLTSTCDNSGRNGRRTFHDVVRAEQSALRSVEKSDTAQRVRLQTLQLPVAFMFVERSVVAG